MKCWCFNQEQLERALAAYRQRIGDPRDRGVNDPMEAVITGFLGSPEAREHKLILDGIWVIPPARFGCKWPRDEAPMSGSVIATPTGALDPKDDTEGRN